MYSLGGGGVFLVKTILGSLTHESKTTSGGWKEPYLNGRILKMKPDEKIIQVL